MKREHAIVLGIVIAILAFLSSRGSDLDSLMHTRIEANPSAEVVLFTTSWCGYCVKARHFLESNGVAYSEFDIERSEEGRLEYERIGGMGVPVFVIDGQTIFGLDLRSVIAALTDADATRT